MHGGCMRAGANSQNQTQIHTLNIIRKYFISTSNRILEKKMDEISKENCF